MSTVNHPPTDAQIEAQRKAELGSLHEELGKLTAHVATQHVASGNRIAELEARVAELEGK